MCVCVCGHACMCDQVQTGFGRLGSHFWGFESQGVVPDIGERVFLLVHTQLSVPVDDFTCFR